MERQTQYVLIHKWDIKHILVTKVKPGYKPQSQTKNLHPVTDGSRCSDLQQSTGLSSWSPVKEREQGSYEQMGQDHDGEMHRSSLFKIMEAH